MNKLSLLFLSILLSIKGFSQIISVDTACLGAPISFKAGSGSITYTWVMNTVDIDQTPTPFISAGVTGLDIANYTSTVYDNGVWYSFITNGGNSNITRLTYTGSPNGAFTQSTIGPYTSTGKMEGIDVLKDTITGNWHGFVVNDGELYRLDFGSSLANAPTSTTYNLAPILNYGHQLNIAKIGNEWIGFVANRSSTIVRLEFGASLTNAPTATTIPNVGSVSAPCNFALHQEGGNWYMLVSNLTANTISRYNFGTNIKNNSPTGVLLGNPGNLLSLPRSVLLLKDCDQLIAYILTEGGDIMKWNFNNSILNTPTISFSMSPGLSSKNSLCTYFTESEMYVSLVTFSSSQLYRSRLLSLPAFDTTKYYDKNLTYNFTTPGKKDITLLTDLGNYMGIGTPSCKSVFIRNQSAAMLNDTTICPGTSAVLDASGTGGTGFSWSTGATTPDITVSTPGKYWVTFSGSPCASSDTVVVSLNALPAVNLGDDRVVCGSPTTTLKNLSAATGSYLWSTGETGNDITVSLSGKYWLEVANGPCKNADSIDVSFKPLPSVNIGGDTVICSTVPLVLQSNQQPAGATYLWNNGSTTSATNVNGSGKYILTVTVDGCSSSDTANIIQFPAPYLDLGNDTVVCSDARITLPREMKGGAKYSLTWQDGSVQNSLVAKQKGKYYATLTNNCGSVTDSISIDYSPCHIYFPNAFSPNGDGVNDIAKMCGNIFGISRYALSIYNRWGQNLRYTENPAEGWDGTFKGKNADLGVYIYTIQFTYKNVEYFWKGNVTLVR